MRFHRLTHNFRSRHKVTAVCLVSSPEMLRRFLLSLDNTELSAGLVVSLSHPLSVSVSPAVLVWNSVLFVWMGLQILPQFHQQLFAITWRQVSQVVLRGQLHEPVTENGFAVYQLYVAVNVQKRESWSPGSGCQRQQDSLQECPLLILERRRRLA